MWYKAVFALGLLFYAAHVQQETAHYGQAGADRVDKEEAKGARSTPPSSAVKRGSKNKEAEWRRKAVRLAAWLEGSNTLRRARAVQELSRLRDPAAVAPLIGVMDRLSVPNQVLVTKALGGIRDKRAYRALAVIGIKNASKQVRQAAIDTLQQLPEARGEYVKVFEHELLVEAKNYSNDCFAAMHTLLATRELHLVELIPALIELQVQLVPAGWKHEVIEAWVIPSGRGGWHGRLRSGIIPVKKPVFLKEVVETLKYLTGQDFGYDKEAWRQWWDRYGESFLKERRAKLEQAKLKATGSVREAIEGQPQRDTKLDSSQGLNKGAKD